MLEQTQSGDVEPPPLIWSLAGGKPVVKPTWKRSVFGFFGWMMVQENKTGCDWQGNGIRD
jgi:hypothetical protein